MWSLTVEPLIPATLWVTLAVLAALLVAWYGLRRPAVITRRRWVTALALMSGGLTLVLVILLNPTWIEQGPRPAGKPLVTVLVDCSASMAMPDAGKGETRYQAAGRIAATLAERLSHVYDVRVRRFAASASPVDPQELAGMSPQGQLTDLSAAIASSLEEQRAEGQGMVLLSDGIHNVGGVSEVLSAVQLARAMAAPVYTKTLGTEAGVWDLAVELKSPQQLTFIGQKVPVVVRVRASSRELAGRAASVVLRHEGQEIGRQNALIPGDGPAEVRFTVSQDKSGLYRYEALVEPIPAEATQANNSAAYLLRVIDKPIRVLFLEGKPYWDAKFLTRTLASDPSIEMDCIVRLSQGRLLWRTLRRSKSQAGAAATASQGSPQAPMPQVDRSVSAADKADPRAVPEARAAREAPAGVEASTAAGTPTAADACSETWKVVPDTSELLGQPETLKAYQVVLLGREAELFLTETAVSNLRTWVSREGGCLLCCRGPPMAEINQRLGRLLPVRWSPARESRFRVKLTAQGEELHWLASSSQGPEDVALTQLPALAATARVEQPKPMATVLATGTAQAGGQETPVVTYQPYGTGRVVVIEGAGMWRWAFLAPAHRRHDDVYGALWQSLVRWLVSGATLLPGQDLDLRTDKVVFNTNEPATATLLIREESARSRIPTIEMTGDALPDVKMFSPGAVGDEPGHFRVVFGALPEGRYQARVAGDTPADSSARTTFDVRAPLQEQLQLSARPDVMARIARDSGGAVLADAAPGEIGQQFAAHLARAKPPQVRRTTAWDRWWILVGVLAVWSAAWSLRRSGGLV